MRSEKVLRGKKKRQRKKEGKSAEKKKEIFSGRSRESARRKRMEKRKTTQVRGKIVGGGEKEIGIRLECDTTGKHEKNIMDHEV